MALDTAVVDVGGIGCEQETSHGMFLLHQGLFAEPQRRRTLGTKTGYVRPAIVDLELQSRPLSPPLGYLGWQRTPRRLDLAKPFEQFLVRLEINALAAIVGMRQREDHPAQRGDPLCLHRPYRQRAAAEQM